MIEVIESGVVLRFSYDDLVLYHGPGFPGGVAHAYKVMERALPVLGGDRPVERREVGIRTSFTGPGGRDAFEMVTRAVTGGRFTVDASLARPERGRTLERYVFCLAYRGREVVLSIREGYVTDEFIALARTEQRDAEQEARLTVLKGEMAARLLARPAEEVYDLAEAG
jgi:hypothetical protein